MRGDAGITGSSNEAPFLLFDDAAAVGRQNRGQAEVDDNEPSFAIAHDILRLEVLMNNVAGVDALKNVKQLHSHRLHVCHREDAVLLIVQAFAEQLHLDVESILPLA